jgi:hypothetical protein
MHDNVGICLNAIAAAQMRLPFRNPDRIILGRAGRIPSAERTEST